MGVTVTAQPRASPPKNALQRRGTTTVVLISVRCSRACQSIDTYYPSVYHNCYSCRWGTSPVLPSRQESEYQLHFTVVTSAIPKSAETDDLGPHDMGSVHPLSTCPFAPFHPTDHLLYCVQDRCVWPIRQFVAAPPVPQKILSLCHGALSLFQVGVATDPVHNRFAVAFNFQGRPPPSL